MKHKGFTLIELLIVITIIGILSTIVICAVSDAKNPDEKSDSKDKTTQTVKVGCYKINDKEICSQ